MKDQQLTIKVEEDVLKISIGTETLFGALSVGRAYGLEGVEITDPGEFIKEFVQALEDEEEDGSTLIHRVFDQAVTNAIDNGALGVRYEEDQ